jgi:HlyD family secretion protein
MTTKKILIGLAILLLVLFGLFKAGIFGKDEGKKVTTEKVQARTIIEYVSGSGKVYPEDEVKITPDIAGKVTELNIQEGDSVKRGQVLARIDADAYAIQRNQAASVVAQSQAQVSGSEAQVQNSRAAMDALQAQIDQAQANYDRMSQMYKEAAVSKSELDVATASLRTAKSNYNAAQQGIRGGVANVQSARASVQNAQATLQRANKDISRTIIVAPRDGVVSLLNIKLGESVAGNSFNVGTEMMRIADMEKIEVRVDVGENNIVKVKLGDSANVTVEAYGERKFRGIVTQIASSNNGASAGGLSSSTSDATQYKVYVRILADSYKDLIGTGKFPFRPGMTANAEIQTNVKRNILSLPINAVTTRLKTDSTMAEKAKNDGDEDAPTSEDQMEVVVFLLTKEGTAQQKKVTTGIQDLYFIEITSNLKAGDEVLTGPYEAISKTLKDKDKVKKVDKKDLYK